MDVAAINYKSRSIGPAPIAIHFLHQVAGRVDHRRIDTGWENLSGPRPTKTGYSRFRSHRREAAVGDTPELSRKHGQQERERASHHETRQRDGVDDCADPSQALARTSEHRICRTWCAPTNPKCGATDRQ